MNSHRYQLIAVTSVLLAIPHLSQAEAIHATAGNAALDTFDIVRAEISLSGNIANFRMNMAAAAGNSYPTATGKLAGSEVFSYVWPTSIDSYEVGFEHDAGILALAVTSHVDFDDTPLFDENGDNNPDNDGAIWHSHWVVLQANEQCGAGALGVVDIPPGASPRLPKTWPGLPILIDSPAWDPIIEGETVQVSVAFDNATAIRDAAFDGVTAGLRVNQSVHAPLLCVVNVFDVASGDLSLPGIVEQ
ncbi:MAG: hypothetical protein DHS20C12_09270 [Pseudohongiella sp.]|nr:MAG: hypothetical protein DHS20C12_09270 [Pseudohongiella sp.]